MRDFTRPVIAPQTFTDAAGNTIEFGNRWAQFDNTPPEDSYSVESHLERFAPLHAVAEALIEHLTTNYEVTVEEDTAVLDDLVYSPDLSEVMRTVRLTPQPTASPLTFVFTRFPSVFVHAGAALDLRYPSCGCDACDETWQSAAEDLEWQTLAIVAGGLTEHLEKVRHWRRGLQRGMGLVRDLKQPASYGLRAADGSQSMGGSSEAADLPQHAQGKLQRLSTLLTDGRWQPWTPRAAE
ncbi:hypothetical protein G7066_08355 [Leucobacter coleopterorum]|uniref:Uncharacterized protein n=1 Tax=Leucobacter coleopterorum TaxID=2714933 RepID=A0ABX6JWE4_9MICO|nr:DUF6226 family protein [Leucobacter coleopterorum]QIM18627.1 hypothetical protein G7066_08355 [Leucobacter coleopterorum]